MTMNPKHFFHLCADGHQAQDFILRKEDFVAAMNIVALCAANTGAVVVAFCLEETHPHFLLYGTSRDCVEFKLLFETTYRHFAASTRPGGAGFLLDIESYGIGEDERYLRNVAAYVVSQPTKDGKDIMPYDYRWGSGSMYFRRNFHIPVWLFDEEGNVCRQFQFGSLTVARKLEITHSRTYSLPDGWLLAGDLVLPSNYVDISLFESIFQTPNCYRVFLSGSRKQDEEILGREASIRGVMLEDTEARTIAGDIFKINFGTRDPRKVDPQGRISVAQILRRQHKMTFRQIAAVACLPESEVRRYVP